MGLVAGLPLTRLISPLLIARAVILRPLRSSIMGRVTEVSLQSEEGVAQDKDWKRHSFTESNRGLLALSLRHVIQI